MDASGPSCKEQLTDFFSPCLSFAQGSLLLIRQIDQPGIVAGVANKLADEKINISFMSVGRTGAGQVRFVQ
eukprot:scaffold118109_cov19-Tisochrysis_lutea.AAC.2